MRALAVADLQRDRLGLVAAGPPLTPPRGWFEVPEPEDPSQGTWTVTADGQVYGYAALWDSCHTGKPGRCVKPPRSASQYGYYMTGLTEVDDGELIPTGRITLGTGHASLTASPAATAEHYDNTGAVAADVRITDGEHGIWVSGALRPDMTPERARELRGASLSGDWRNIRGKLEMLGLLAVNVPGFPVPRTMTASAEYEGHEEVMAMVAAGVIEGPLILPEQLEDISEDEYEAGLQNLLDAMALSEAMTAPIEPVDAALASFSASGKRYAEGGGGESMAPEVIRLEAGQWVSFERGGETFYVVNDGGELRELTAAAFDESKHPRHEKGHPEGGRFAPKGAGRGQAEHLTDMLANHIEQAFNSGVDPEDLDAVQAEVDRVLEDRLDEEIGDMGISSEERAQLEQDVRANLEADYGLADDYGRREDGTWHGPKKGAAERYDVSGNESYQKVVNDLSDRYMETYTQQRNAGASDAEARSAADDAFWDELDLQEFFGEDELYELFPDADPESGEELDLMGLGEELHADVQKKLKIDPDYMTAAGDPMDLPVVAAGRFDESKHPRHKKGEKDGGKFAPKDTASEADLDNPRAEVPEYQGQQMNATEWGDRTGSAISRAIEKETGHMLLVHDSFVDNEAWRKMWAEGVKPSEAAKRFLKGEGATEQGKKLLERVRQMKASGELPAARPPEPRPDDAVLAASFTAPQREKLAKKGQAMKDGSFPIRNRSDLRNAIASVGRASDPDAARRWIIRRARELKAVHELPASWDVEDSVQAAGFFDESKHPRHEKGSKQGGEFAPKGAGKGQPFSQHHGAEAAKRAADIGQAIDDAKYAEWQNEHAVTVDGKKWYPDMAPDEWDSEMGRPAGTLTLTDESGEAKFLKPSEYGKLTKSKMVTGPGGKQMSRTEAGVLLDKQRAGTPSAKADRAAKAAREAGDAPAYLQTPNQTTGEQRLAEARAAKNYNKSLDVEPEPEIAALADRFKTPPRGSLTTAQHVMASFPELSQTSAKKVASEVARRQRLEDIRAGRVRYTDAHV